MTIEGIEYEIDKLPEHEKKEIIDYIQFLLNKYKVKENDNRKFKFDWAGGLKRLKKKYTSVELQHKASEWR